MGIENSNETWTEREILEPTLLIKRETDKCDPSKQTYVKPASRRRLDDSIYISSAGLHFVSPDLQINHKVFFFFFFIFTALVHHLFIIMNVV